MKKVCISIQGRVDRIGLSSTTYEDLEDYANGEMAFDGYDFEDVIVGWEGQLDVTAEVDGKEVYSGQIDLSENNRDLDHLIIKGNIKDWNVKDFPEEIQVIIKKNIQEAIDNDLNDDEIGDCNEIAFREAFGFNSTVKKLDLYDERPVAVDEQLGIGACYTYDFEIPDNENFDISKLYFGIDDSEFFEDCGQRVIISPIMYGNNFVEMKSADEGPAKSDELKGGILHLDSTGYIEYQ